MILMHRGQRGASVTKAWRGVRRIERPAASRRVASCRVEDSLAQARVKAQNIAHRSDLAPLCISNIPISVKGAKPATKQPTAQETAQPCK